MTIYQRFVAEVKYAKCLTVDMEGHEDYQIVLSSESSFS